MEIIFELLFQFAFQFVVQFLGEVLLEAGFEGLARLLSTRTSRLVAGTLVLLVGGFGFGWYWGNRYAGRFGTSDIPTSLVVSVCFAIGFAILTGVSALREYWARDRRPPVDHGPVELWDLDRWLPWRWPPARLASFALLNCTVAIGITVGFTPEDVRLR